MEFGPRALGRAVILADPAAGDARPDEPAVKQREAFRPFAPAAWQTTLPSTSPSTTPRPTCWRPAGHLAVRPARDHPRGRLGRLQTVDVESIAASPCSASVSRRTGCPLLVNTSFNMRGQPIVCSPVDALFCLQSGLDCLVLEDFLLDSAAVPETWFIGMGTRPGCGSHDI